MQLVGYTVLRIEGPVSEAHIRLGDLTVAFGPNDAGKTRLLRGLAAHLSGTRTNPLDTEGRRMSESAAIFGQLPLARFADIISRASSRGTEGTQDDESDHHAGDDEDKHDGDEDHPEARDDDTHTSIDASKLLAQKVLEECVLAFVPPLPGEEWKVFVASPPFDDLEPYLAAEVERLSGVTLYPTTLPVGSIMRHFSSITPDAWKWVPGSPLPVAELPSWLAGLLPVVVLLPTSPNLIYADIEQSIRDLMPLVGGIDEFRTRDFRGSFEPSDADEELSAALAVDPQPDSILLSSDDGRSLTIRHDALAAADVIQTFANRLLPRFIAENYLLVVDLQLANPDVAFTVVALEDRITRTRFTLDQAAAGFELWIQLALLEGVDSLRQLTAQLRVQMDEIIQLFKIYFEDYVVHSFADGESEEDWEELLAIRQGELLDGADTLIASLDAFRSCEWANTTLPPRIDDALEIERIQHRATERHLRSLRSRFYVIDEPERHLHPRLQREASRWLASTMKDRRSQCLVASHSVAFLGLGEETRFFEVRRGDEAKSHVEEFSPEDLTALDALAEDVGLDRGELLSLYECILFVEGKADEAVLEALFSKRLHHAGIVVVPLGGVIRAKQIPVTDVLFRFTQARSAVLLDDVTKDQYQRVLKNHAFLVRSLKSTNTSLNALAQLVQSARRHKRRVQIYHHSGKDIFDLLDEGVLHERFPAFPGHVAAREAHRLNGDGIHWKEFYRENYGIPPAVNAVYAPVAQEMRESNTIPVELVAIMDSLERYAAGPND
jgi:hypothetical protein